MRPVLLLALVAQLAGCSVMSDQRVDGWPALEIVEHHVSGANVQERCARYVGFGMVPVACAEFDLAARKCHLWFNAEQPPASFVVEHERQHCRGFDHIGSTNMRDFLSRSKQ